MAEEKADSSSGGGGSSEVCIGSLEHHLHKVFASVRVPGEDFVYSPSTELYNMLDDFCAEETMHQPAVPIIVTGQSGTGKSALLSNWVERRQRNAARSRVGHITDEFIFWHAVGCTRQSLNVNSLLRRLMLDLRERFDLVREVPIAQERLSWELPRFLEMAAKRGRLIIIIDGLHRLLTNEDTEASLAWLPLEFPPNVRVILTVTESSTHLDPQFNNMNNNIGSQSLASGSSSVTPLNAPTGGATNENPAGGQSPAGSASPSRAQSPLQGSFGGAGVGTLVEGNGATSSNGFLDESSYETTDAPLKKSRIITELERRQWLPRALRPLDRSLCRLAVETYMQKSTQSEASKMATGPFLTALKDEEGSLGTLDEAPGFLLFDTQVAALLSHPLGGTPLFLRLFLRCTHYAVSRGFSLWFLWDHWLGAVSVSELIVRVLKSFEEGQEARKEDAEACRARTIAAGGLPALRLLYPWHPNLKEKPTEPGMNVRADAVASYDLAAYASEHHLTDDSAKAESKGVVEEPSTTQQTGLSHMVRQNLGDQMLLKAAASAHDKMLVARKKAEDSIEATMHFASNSIAAFINNRIEELSITGSGDASYEVQEAADAQSLAGGSTANMSATSYLSDASAVTLEYLEGVLAHMRVVRAQREREDALDPTYASSGQAADTDEGQAEGGEGDVEGEEGEEVDPEGAEDEAAEESKTPTTPYNTSASSNLNSQSDASETGTEESKGAEGDGGQLSTLENGARRKKSKRDGGETTVTTTRFTSKRNAMFVNVKGKTSPENPNNSNYSGKKSFMGDYEEEDESVQEDTREVDPAEGIDQVPRYFRGGADVAGFSTLLGNALALLYVARHGLKEQELWGLLAALQRQEESTRVAAEGLLLGRQDSAAYRQALCKLCFAARGSLEDLWRIEDTFHSGMLPPPALLRGLQRIHPTLSRKDLDELLLAVNLYTAGTSKGRDEDDYDHVDASASQQSGKRAEGIDYLEIIKRLGKLDKAGKLAETRAKLSRPGGGNAHINDLDAFDAMEGGNGNTNPNTATTAGATLGPVLEESLLLVLCALGVLHSPEFQVLVLPSDADIFRSCVLHMYVESRGGEGAWHGHLIRHFGSEPNSMRRCEELPWHLQICRRWVSMKMCLADLSTFVMMYDSSDLRDEFMAYWNTLTTGPMYVSDEAHKAAMLAKQKHVEDTMREDRHRDPELALLCKQMDLANALHLNEKEFAKYRLRMQVGVFDVVEEFNKSLELWVAMAKPDPHALHDKLLHVARFLAEFGSKREKLQKAPFLRMGVPLRMLDLFNVHPDHTLREFAVEPLADEEEGDASPGGVAGTTTGTAGKDGAKDGVSVSASQAENSKKVPTDKIKRGGAWPMFPSTFQLQDNNYFCMRWLWVQFPWLCLQTTAEVGSILKVGGLTSVLAEVAASRIETGAKFSPTKRLTSTDSVASLETEDEATRKARERQIAAVNASTRMWDVKKVDPTKYAIASSQARTKAAINAAMTPQVFLDGMALALRRVRDDIIKAGEASRKMPPKYRRSLEQEELALEGIPHAYHTTRVVKLHSLFPSIERAIAAKNEKIKEDAGVYAQAMKELKRGGTGLSLEGSLESELKRLTEEETMAQWNAKRGGALPMGSAEEVELEREFERVSKLRSLCDRVNVLVRDRGVVYDALRRQVEARDIQDEEVASFMLVGEQAIVALKDKLQVMTDALEAGKKLNNGYDLLIEMLQAAAPSSEQHISSIQQQLALSKQQLQDLKSLRQKMYLDAERLHFEKSKQFVDKLTYYQEARKGLQQKMSKINPKRSREKVSAGGARVVFAEASLDGSAVTGEPQPPALDEAIDDANAFPADSAGSDGAKAPVEDLKTRYKREKEERLKKERDASVVRQFDDLSLAQHVLKMFKPWDEVKAEMDVRARVTQCRLMYEFAMSRTNSTNEDDFIARLKEGRKMTETLRAQQTMGDARVLQLKQEREELQIMQDELLSDERDAPPSPVHGGSTSNASGTAGAGDRVSEVKKDVRYYDSMLFNVEIRAQQTQRQLEKNSGLINEVRMGVGHLMALLHANTKLLHNLPKSKMPELSSTDNILTCLSWCEDRILAINEAQMVDSKAGPGGQSGDEAKPFWERQTALASLVDGMMSSRKDKSHQSAHSQPRVKAKGGLSAGILSSDVTALRSVSSPRGVLVPAAGRGKEEQLADRVDSHLAQQDAREDLYESSQLEHGVSASVAGVHRFLTEALATKASSNMLRKANLAANNRAGRNAGFGWAIEDLLKGQDKAAVDKAAKEA